MVIHFSDWKTLAVWRSVCRAFLDVVAAHLRCRYQTRIRPFISDIPVFDNIMRTFGAIISGSTALRYFLDDDDWSPNDLDIYVANDNWDPLLASLTEADSLGLSLNPPVLLDPRAHPTPKPVPTPSAPSTSSILPLLQDLHPDEGDEETNTDSEADSSSDDDEVDPRTHASAKDWRSVKTLYTATGRKIDVIRSPANNSMTPLCFFWSTLVMNFLTPDACVCGYPSITFQRFGILKLGSLRVRDKAALAKYEGRGFSVAGCEWRDVLDMWDYLFFGERNAMVLEFRKHDGAKASLPIRRTTRGWVPAFNNTLRTPGQFAYIPSWPPNDPLTIPPCFFSYLAVPIWRQRIGSV